MSVVNNIEKQNAERANRWQSYMGEIIKERLSQLHRGKPKASRWQSAYIRLDRGWTYDLSYIKEESLASGWISARVGRIPIVTVRYRLKHIECETTIYWETLTDLLADMNRKVWLNCTLDECSTDDMTKYLVFPIVTKKKLKEKLMTDDGLRELPVELVDMIVNYTI